MKRADGLKWRYAIIGDTVAPNAVAINKLPGPEFNAMLAWVRQARHGEIRRAGQGLILAIDHGKLAEAWHRGEYSPYAEAAETPENTAVKAP